VPRKKKPAESGPQQASSPTQYVARDERGRLLPGSHIEASGRGAAGGSRVAKLANHIAEITSDGRILATQLFEIAQGRDHNARTADKIRAIEVLWERMAGKAIDVHAMVDLTDKRGAREHGTLAADLLEQLIRQLPAPGASAEVVDGEVAGEQPAALDPKDE
jgi:hypothetical protein